MSGVTDRLERELDAARTAHPRDSARYIAVLERAVRSCRADPDAADALDPADLFLELATEYQAVGRWEDALVAADAAVDAGRGVPPDLVLIAERRMATINEAYERILKDYV